MKYLFLFLVLALGYEGYTHWSEFQSKYASLHDRVVAATAAAQGSKTPPVTGPVTVPGQTAPAILPAPPAQAVAASPVATQAAAAQPAAPSMSVAASQKQAIAKYPALTVAGSEMNSRFVFRYKRMVSEKSPRLQDPTWPMQLADECNEAIVASKPKPKTPLEKTHPAGSLAAAKQVPTP